MRKIIIFTLIVSIILSITILPVAAVTLPEKVRVGIYFGDSSLTEAVISASGGVMVVSEMNNVWMPAATVSVYNGAFSVSGAETPFYDWSAKLTVIPTGGFLELNGKQYRGEIELIKSETAMTVVNHLNIEEYLYGVVPLEMATGWPMEALKAQAVCARTYVAKSIGKYMSQGFDVYNTTMSQVYGGVNVEKADCTQAVDETRGMVITYGGQLIDAVYCSSMSNAHSFNVKDVWGSNVGYLKGVPDVGLSTALPGGAAWEKSFTNSELKNQLAASNINIGDITDLRIDAVSNEGAVTKLTFVGTMGNYTAERSSARNLLGLRSQSYTIEKILGGGSSQNITVLSAYGKSPIAKLSAISSNGMIYTPQKIITSTGIFDLTGAVSVVGFKLKGSGYGHGLGMSQYGANGMAKMGYTYDQIIKHYYTGVELVQATN